MVDYVICEYNDIKDIADAVRSKTGSDAAMSFNSIASAINGISGGGDDDLLFQRINGTLTSFESDQIVALMYAAFAKCSMLTSVSLPMCIEIHSNAFFGCSKLASVSIPRCQRIGGTHSRVVSP